MKVQPPETSHQRGGVRGASTKRRALEIPPLRLAVRRSRSQSTTPPPEDSTTSQPKSWEKIKDSGPESKHLPIFLSDRYLQVTGPRSRWDADDSTHPW